MITVLNNDCSILTLTSDGLTTSPSKTFTSLVLKSKLNCSLTEDSVDVSELIPDISNKSIQIPATLFYGNDTQTTYCDGVYYFKLVINYTTDPPSENPTYIEDSACQIIDCTLKCKVFEQYNKTNDRKLIFYYYALTQGPDCDSCSCTEMCSIYTELKNLLNDNSTTTGGCGCT